MNPDQDIKESIETMEQIVHNAAERITELHAMIDYERRFKSIVQEGLANYPTELNRLMNQVSTRNAYIFAYTEPNSIDPIVIFGPCYEGHLVAEKIKQYLHSNLESDPLDVESEFIFDLDEDESVKFGHLIDNFDFYLKEYMNMSQYKIKEEGYVDIELMEALYNYSKDKFTFDYGSHSILITPLDV